MIACNCIMGRFGRCCQDPYLYLKPPFPEYQPNPIVLHPLNTPDGQRIIDLEERIKQLEKQLSKLKKKETKNETP